MAIPHAAQVDYMTTQLASLESQLTDKRLIENALADAEKGRTEATQRLEKALKENASIMTQVRKRAGS